MTTEPRPGAPAPAGKPSYQHICIEVDDINATVAQMDEMTQKNAALVEESAAAARALEGQASELGQLIGLFTLSAGSRAGAPIRAPATRSPLPAQVPATPAVPRPTVAQPRPGAPLRRNPMANGNGEWQEF